MAAKKDSTMLMAIVGVVAVAAIGGAVVLSQKSKERQTQQLADGSVEQTRATADAAARIREAEVREREAELAAETRKREIDALDKPIGDRLLDSVMDAGKLLLGSLKL